MGVRKNRELLTSFLLAGALAGCGNTADTSDMTPAPTADMAQLPDLSPAPDLAPAPTTDQLLQSKISNIVFIYAENRSFDNLFGLFPGADGIPGVNKDSKGTYIPQIDRDGVTTLSKLPMVWGGVTAAGQMPAVTQMMTDGVMNKPFQVDMQYAGVTMGIVTRDLYHRFFENQMQIDGGKNDLFAAWADSGGLVMGYYDTTNTALWQVAKNYVLADNFYQAAFGGSFLNHQYVICACAPEYPNADTDPAKPTITVINQGTTTLTPGAMNAASALTSAPSYVLSGNIAPKNYFNDGTFRAINTMQPPYQPSANPPAANDMTKLYADRSKATTLPPQTGMTVGDQLEAKSINYKWYAGGFKQTLATATSDRAFPSGNPIVVPNYQFHHQPFNYYAKFDPMTGAAERTAHLADGTDFVADAAAGTLPPVAFYKPEGDVNQHAGYTNIMNGDAHLADVISKLKASPQWKGMVIVLTYDENGGWWDHKAPPKGDLLGPGTRIPALIVSPYAKAGTVDHTIYDTGSILRLINRRFGLTPLPGTATRDAAIKASSGSAPGDFTAALDLTK